MHLPGVRNGYVTIRSGPEHSSPWVRGLVEIGLEACHAGALVALAAVHAFAAGINHTTDTTLGADDELRAAGGKMGTQLGYKKYFQLQLITRRNSMITRQLGSGGPRVSALGLGCMGMSDYYGPADRTESIATIHAALDAGITLLDTGDFYGMGHNELLLNDALQGRNREQVVISVKFGALRDPAGGSLGNDGRPASVKNFLAYTLRRLGTDYVDVYRPARVDPTVPIEDTIGAVADMVKAGYVRHIGLSEAGADTIRRAHAVHPISDLQIEYSLLDRGIEENILPTCRELGIGVTAYGVLARGLLSGHWSRERSLALGDFRSFAPRFSGENLDHNLALVEALRAIAEAKGVTVALIAIAWVLSRGSDIVPLVGARRRDRLNEALGALEFPLTPADLAQIEHAVPVGAAAGDRYPAVSMARLDSERS